MKNIKTFDSLNPEEISESLSYHINNGIDLLESVYRIGSDSWLECINEARDLWERGIIDLEEDDIFLISTDAGRKGIYEGEEVILDVPLELEEEINEAEGKYMGRKVTLNKPSRMSGKRKFRVFTRNDRGNVVKVEWGQPGATVKNDDPKASKSFRARHRCKTPGPRWKPRWWACNVGRYAKLLGLKSNNPW